MSRKKRLEELFKKWKSRKIHKGEAFICDGMFDKKKWEEADKKILFLGKELPNRSQDSWDLTDRIREGYRSKLWWNVARWAYGIQSTTESCIKDFPGEEEATEPLLSCAFVNIKKSGGKSPSNDDDLKKYVESDKTLIKKQINLLEPDVIVFCGTWKFVEHLWDNPDEISDLVYKKDQRILIDYHHPAFPCRQKVMFFALCFVYQKALQRENNVG